MTALSFLNLAGAGAALMLAVRLLTVPTENRPAAQALAAFLVCAALFVCDNACYAAEAFDVVPWFYALANPFIVALGPVFLLYTRAASEPAFAWSPGKLAHFTPCALVVALDFPVYFLPAGEKVRMASREFEPEAWPVMLALSLYLIGYIGGACWNLWRRRHRLEEEIAEGRSHPVRGLSVLAGLVFAILLFSTVADFTPWAKQGNNAVALGAVIGVFSLLWTFTQPTRLVVPAPAGVPGATAPVGTAIPAPATTLCPEPAAPVPASSAPIANPVPRPESQERRLPDAEIARIADRVRALLEREKAHLDPELSLQKLAERAKTTRHNLSFVLKEAFGATFYQLVAGYRVRDAAQALAAPAATRRTIADIAFGCGFNTLSAFNAAFRAQFGVTPSAFRDSAQKKPTELSPTA